MVTKIGLPENRRRLKGAGIEHARSASFDEGYNAGFDAGVKHYREQLADSLHHLGIGALNYDGNNALIHAYQAVNIALGNQTWQYYIEEEQREYEASQK